MTTETEEQRRVEVEREKLLKRLSEIAVLLRASGRTGDHLTVRESEAFITRQEAHCADLERQLENVLKGTAAERAGAERIIAGFRDLAQWMHDAATSLGGSAEAAKRDPETRDSGFAMEGEAAAFRACAEMVRDGEPPKEAREE